MYKTKGCRMISLLAVFNLIFFCVPIKSTAEIGGIHFYAFPGAWAMDVPDGSISQHHIRQLKIDKWRDKDGHERSEMGDALTGIDDVAADQYIIKIGYIYHVGSNKQFQWTHLAIVPFADIEVKLTDTAAAVIGRKHFRDNGTADPYWYNSFGWHNEKGTLHLSAGLHVRFPFGEYDKHNPASPGLNRFEFFPAVYAHLRYPMDKGLWMFDIIQNFLYITENHAIDFDEKDTMESNMIASYFFSKQTRKFGLFTQLDYMRAVNNSKTQAGKLDDKDAWSFAVGLGLVYSIRPNIIANIKYTEDVDGKQSRMDKAANFMLTWKF
jgi:hypothetical protein